AQDRSLALWRSAIEANPHFAEAEKNLGAALFKKRGKGYLALEHLERYLELGGRDARVKQWVDEIRERARTFRTDDKALAVFDRLESKKLFVADGSFELADDALPRAKELQRGDRVRLTFDGKAGARVVLVERHNDP